MRELTWDDFSDAAGRVYAVAAGDQRVDFTLDQIEQLPHSPRASGAFRLEFVGPLDPVLDQGIYPFSDDGDGFEIFIVPIAREPAGMRYEAVFF